MVKIEKIKIKNFKKIKNLEFEPAKVNIILGPNNTGKTSVLEAIYLALVALDSQDILYKYKISYRLAAWKFLKLRTGDKTIVEFDLFNFNRKQPFNIEAIIDGIQVYVRYEDFEKIVGECYNHKGEKVKTLEISTRPTLNFSSAKAVKDINYIFIEHHLKYELIKIWEEIDKRLSKSEKDELLKDLKEKFDISQLTIHSVKFDSPDKKEYYIHYIEDDKPPLPFFMLGSGVQYLIILTVLTHVCDVILFDDLEAALHPDIIDLFVKIIKDSKSQFFFTTQNKELIEKIIEEIDDMKIIYLYRDGSYSIFDKENAKKLLKLRGDVR